MAGYSKENLMKKELISNDIPVLQNSDLLEESYQIGDEQHEELTALYNDVFDKFQDRPSISGGSYYMIVKCGG